MVQIKMSRSVIASIIVFFSVLKQALVAPRFTSVFHDNAAGQISVGPSALSTRLLDDLIIETRLGIPDIDLVIKSTVDRRTRVILPAISK